MPGMFKLTSRIKLNDKPLEIEEKFYYPGNTIGAKRGTTDIVLT